MADEKHPPIAANVAWRDDGAPRSLLFDDIYFSPEGGLAEARHVFLNGNFLAERFATADRFAVGELGFGTGLNFLACWALWRQRRKPGARLDYFSVEGFPVAPADLRRALDAFPEMQQLADQLCSVYAQPPRGFHHFDFSKDGLYLTLGIGEVEQVLKDAEGLFNAWFLDGFAPSRNPEMWRDEVLTQVARLSAADTTVATFSVAGSVRRGLARAGFLTEKRPGFGAKRDMLAARIDASAHAVSSPPSSDDGPWFAPAIWAAPPDARIAVIGAGIAGASAAYGLKCAGFDPVVFERGEALGAGASGNPAALVMPWLDADAGPLSEFHCTAFGYATRLYRKFMAVDDELFDACGAIWLARSEGDAKRFDKIISRQVLLPHGELEALAAPEVSKLVSVECSFGALYFPRAGMVAPLRLVEQFLSDVAIKFGTPISTLDRDGRRWRLLEESGADAGAFDAVIVADGSAAAHIRQTRHLPLSGSIGQLTYTDQLEPPLGQAIVSGAYAAPLSGRGAVAGATYRNAALECRHTEPTPRKPA